MAQDLDNFLVLLSLAASAVALCLNRWLSLPVSTVRQWCVSPSSKAIVIFGPPKLSAHSAKPRFVVIGRLFGRESSYCCLPDRPTRRLTVNHRERPLSMTH